MLSSSCHSNISFLGRPEMAAYDGQSQDLQPSCRPLTKDSSNSQLVCGMLLFAS
jgi:hypothetical protein